jgi:hypothetical protein
MPKCFPFCGLKEGGKIIIAARKQNIFSLIFILSLGSNDGRREDREKWRERERERAAFVV